MLIVIDDVKTFHRVIIELQPAKAVITGVFSKSYCYYGNLLCDENDNNAFTNDWAVFETMIVAPSDKKLFGNSVF